MKPAWGWDIRRAEEEERKRTRKRREEDDVTAKERGYTVETDKLTSAAYEPTKYVKDAPPFEVEIERCYDGWEITLWRKPAEDDDWRWLMVDLPMREGYRTAADAMIAGDIGLDAARRMHPAALAIGGSGTLAKDMEDDGDPTGGHGG